MKLIVAVTENWGIGAKGGLLKSLPEDMAFFREKTRGAAVVMGQTTFESFPGRRPLKGRANLVLSQDASFAPESVTVLRSVEELRAALAALPEAQRDNVWVIGGGSIYRLLLPYCDEAYITRMALTLPADVYFPDLDAEPDWTEVDPGTPQVSGGVGYRFTRWRNAAVRPL